MDIQDLPPWAQAQAMKQITERKRKGGGKSPALPSLLPAEGGSKYHSCRETRTTPAGKTVTFDSRKEARRYDALMTLLAAGAIRDLKLQPEFTLQEAYTTTEGVRVRAIRYQGDFSYERATSPDCNGEIHWIRVVEDVKSPATKTRVYEIKKKLMQERFGIDVREV